jgi:DNA-binding transcriptional regulator GbsR (MarR family)
MSETGVHVTMTTLAGKLGVSISTVSRAVTKLQAFGLLAIAVARGKYGGMWVMRRAKDDGLDAFRRAAKARVRRWYEAAQARVSRLESNLAPYFTLDRKGVSMTLTPTSTHRAQDWTPEELREAGII